MPLVDGINTLAPLTLAMITVGYAATVAFWPFKACRHCHGTGRLRSPVLRATRLCPRCEATGLRLRAGRNAWNTVRRLHRTNHRNRTQSHRKY